MIALTGVWLALFVSRVTRNNFLFYHLGKVYHGHKQNLCKNLFSAFLDPEIQKVVTGEKRGSWKSITYKKGPLGGQWLEKKKTDKNY